MTAADNPTEGMTMYQPPTPLAHAAAAAYLAGVRYGRATETERLASRIGHILDQNALSNVAIEIRKALPNP